MKPPLLSFMFCGSEQLAADFAMRYLAGQVKAGYRLVAAVEKTAPEAAVVVA